MMPALDAYTFWYRPRAEKGITLITIPELGLSHHHISRTHNLVSPPHCRFTASRRRPMGLWSNSVSRRASSRRWPGRWAWSKSLPSDMGITFLRSSWNSPTSKRLLKNPPMSRCRQFSEDRKEPSAARRWGVGSHLPTKPQRYGQAWRHRKGRKLAQPRWEERVPPLSGREFFGHLGRARGPFPSRASLHRHLPQRAHAWHARVFQQSPKGAWARPRPVSGAFKLEKIPLITMHFSAPWSAPSMWPPCE